MSLVLLVLLLDLAAFLTFRIYLATFSNCDSNDQKAHIFPLNYKKEGIKGV